MRKLHFLLLALWLVAALPGGIAQVFQSLPISGLSLNDQFGYSVAINGDGKYIVVGTPGHANYEDPAHEKEGVGYVYVRSGNSWVIQDTLSDSTLEIQDAMGIAVSINEDGNRIALGVPGLGMNQGDVRVFSRTGTTWTLLPLIDHTGNGGFNTGASPHDEFGTSVSLDATGNYLAVGSPLHNTKKGRANVCRYDPIAGDWANDYASIPNPAEDKGDFYGYSIALDATGNHLVIGAYGEDNGNGGKNNEVDEYGAVYYYKRITGSENTWSFVQKINPAVLTGTSQFGYSVDLNSAGDSLIVGAPGHGSSGAVFFFQKTGIVWTQTEIVTGYNSATEDMFGASVALSGDGDIALIGAPQRDSLGTVDVGATHIFQNEKPVYDWAQKITLALPSGYSGGDIFGSSVAIASNIFYGVMGAPFFNNFKGGAFVVLPSALPVTWLSFRALLIEEEVHLSWSTGSESNNEGFDVERSYNGRDWETIGFVSGAGTTSELQNYVYTDQSPVTDHQSLVFYRLKQKDFNGDFEYSPVRVVELDGTSGIRIYPNPVSEYVTVSFGEPIEVQGWVQLLTGTGRLIMEQTIPLNTADFQLRVAPLPSSTYILKVKVGSKEWSERLMVE